MELHQAIENYMKLENSSELQQTLLEIISSHVDETNHSIQDLIGLLEQFLVSSNDRERNRATTLLADLLHIKNELVMRSAVIHLFVVFFSRRLADYPSVAPSLHALSALIRFHGDRMESKYFDAVDIMQSVFKDLNVPTYPQNVRQKVFTLFDDVLSSASIVSSLQSIGPEVVNGVLDCMEQEKDPRCLLQALQAVGKVVTCFSPSITGSLAEKVFESTSCYFPITFVPPPDDPYGITPESLTDALNQCLCSHKEIVLLTVQFLVNQQLMNELPAARLHAMSSLVLIVHKYTHTVLRSEQSDTTQSSHDSLLAALAEHLYEMATDDTNSEYISKALWAIEQITTSIGRDLTGKYLSDWRCFVDPMLRRISGEVHGNLSGIQAKMAVNVAFSIARAGYMCCGAVVNMLVPLLCNKTQDMRNVLVTSLSRSLLAERKGFSVLPSMAAQESILCTSVEMLGQLIACSYDINVGRVGTARSNSTATSAGMDFSQMLSLDPLRPHCVALFDALSSYLYMEDVSRTALSASESSGLTAGDSEIIPPQQQQPVTNFERLLAFQPTLDKLAVIVESGKAMRELLMRVPSSDIDPLKLAAYIRTLGGIALHGLSYIWLHSAYDEQDTALLTVESTVIRSPKEDPIKACFLSLIVSLAGNHQYDTILKDHCVQPLLQSLSHCSAAVTVNIYAILSAIARGSKGDALIATFLPHLTSSIDHSVERVSQYATLEIDIVSELRVLVQVVNTVRDLLEGEPAVPVTTTNTCAAHSHTGNGQECGHDHSGEQKSKIKTATTVVDNELKGRYLAGTAESPVLRVITQVLSACNKIFVHRSEQTVATAVNDVIQSLLSVIRRIVCALKVDEQTIFVSTLLSHVLSNINNTSHTSLLTAVMTSALTYVDKSSSLFTTCGSIVQSMDEVESVLRTSSNVLSVVIRVTLGTVTKPTNSVAGISNVTAADCWTTQYGTAQLLAIIINKLPSGHVLQYVVSSVVNTCMSFQNGLLADETLMTDTDEHTITQMVDLFLWTFKSVFMRSVLRNNTTHCAVDSSWQDILLSQLTETLVDTRTSPTRHVAYRDYLATKLSALVEDHSGVLSVVSRGHCSPFWKQKLWSLLFPPLLSNANQFISNKIVSNVTSSSSILAICTLTAGLPVNITQNSLQQLVDIAVYAVSYSHENIDSSREATPLQTQSMRTMEILLRNDASGFVSYLNIIVPVLLKVAQSAYSARERGTAVEALSALADQLPYPRIHPHKKTIVKGLQSVLDDRKRVVRQLAGATRNKYMMLK